MRSPYTPSSNWPENRFNYAFFVTFFPQLIAGPDLSPEKKQKILSQIKIVSDRWRPFLTEAAAAIEGESKKAER